MYSRFSPGRHLVILLIFHVSKSGSVDCYAFLNHISSRVYGAPNLVKILQFLIIPLSQRSYFSPIVKAETL